MSYILDALKKSEVQRHAGRIPTVAAPHGVLIEPPRASRLGLLGGIVVALAVVVGASWWWASRFLDRPVQAVAVLPPSPAAPTVPQSRVDNGAAQVSVESTQSSQALPRLKLAISLPPREPPAVGPSGDQAKPVVQLPQTTTPPAPGRDAATPIAARSSGVVPYADLPLAIRQGMPPLVVGGFAAGDSGGAMLMIDDKLVREGDEVAPGIRVEKILSDTAEFSFKGYRFRR